VFGGTKCFPTWGGLGSPQQGLRWAVLFGTKKDRSSCTNGGGSRIANNFCTFAMTNVEYHANPKKKGRTKQTHHKIF